jgi:hypothetical protein
MQAFSSSLNHDNKLKVLFYLVPNNTRKSKVLLEGSEISPASLSDKTRMKEMRAERQWNWAECADSSTVRKACPCAAFHDKYHIDWPGIELRHTWGGPGD